MLRCCYVYLRLSMRLKISGDVSNVLYDPSIMNWQISLISLLEGGFRFNESDFQTISPPLVRRSLRWKHNIIIPNILIWRFTVLQDPSNELQDVGFKRTSLDSREQYEAQQQLRHRHSNPANVHSISYCAPTDLIRALHITNVLTLQIDVRRN